MEKKREPGHHGKAVIKAHWMTEGTMVEIPDNVIVCHPVDYMNLCRGLHLWDLALDTLKEVIDLRIHTNYYSRKSTNDL